MQDLNSVIFVDSYPKLDLHGYDRETARVAIEDFITDDTFFAEKVNVLNHNTAVYHISTAAEIQYITELWNSVHVNIC